MLARLLANHNSDSLFHLENPLSVFGTKVGLSMRTWALYGAGFLAKCTKMQILHLQLLLEPFLLFTPLFLSMLDTIHEIAGK